MNFIKHFFSYDFQFYINGTKLETVDYVFGIIAIASVGIGIAFKIAAIVSKNPITKKVLQRLFVFSVTIGLLGVLWYGLRYQAVRFFGTHFVFILILLAGVIWKARIGWYVLRKYRTDKKAYEKEQLKQKYLQ